MEPQFATIEQLNTRLLEIDRILVRSEFKGTKESFLTSFEKIELEQEAQGIVNVMAKTLSEKTGHSPEELIQQQNEYRELLRLSERMKASAETESHHPDAKELLLRAYDPATPREESIHCLTSAIYGETEEEKIIRKKAERSKKTKRIIGTVVILIAVALILWGLFTALRS